MLAYTIIAKTLSPTELQKILELLNAFFEEDPSEYFWQLKYLSDPKSINWKSEGEERAYRGRICYFFIKEVYLSSGKSKKFFNKAIELLKTRQRQERRKHMRFLSKFKNLFSSSPCLEEEVNKLSVGVVAAYDNKITDDASKQKRLKILKQLMTEGRVQKSILWEFEKPGQSVDDLIHIHTLAIGSAILCKLGEQPFIETPIPASLSALVREEVQQSRKQIRERSQRLNEHQRSLIK